MKKLANITILTLSISLAPASILARQALDPTDYIGYAHGAYVSGQNIDDREARRVGQLLWGQDQANNDREARRVGKLLWDQDADDREARRVGKLLWTDNHV